MTLLVVVAHPDDETFGCGSILLHAAERSRTVVVCATRGEAGENAGNVPLANGGLAEVRESELRAAATLLGVDQVEVLNCRDSGMTGTPPAGSLCAAPIAPLVETIKNAIARYRPTVLVTLDGSDGHRDHQRVRDAVLAAAPAELRLYLACLPQSLLHEWLQARAPTTGDPYADLPDFGSPDDQVTTVIDTSRHYATRLKAIAEHRSQTSPYDGLPEDLRRRFLATEHLLRVQPPWPGGDPESDLVGPDTPRVRRALRPSTGRPEGGSSYRLHPWYEKY